MTLAAHALLSAADLDFAGNCEGRDALTGDLHVMVADGFSGNVLLKGLEGAGAALIQQLRDAAATSLRAKLGGLLLRPAVREMRSKVDPATYGGAYLLGVRGLVSIAHGNSSRVAIRNAIHVHREGRASGGRRAARRTARGGRADAPHLPTSSEPHTVPHVAATERGEEQG